VLGTRTRLCYFWQRAALILSRARAGGPGPLGVCGHDAGYRLCKSPLWRQTLYFVGPHPRAQLGTDKEQHRTQTLESTVDEAVPTSSRSVTITRTQGAPPTAFLSHDDDDETSAPMHAGVQRSEPTPLHDKSSQHLLRSSRTWAQGCLGLSRTCTADQYAAVIGSVPTTVSGRTVRPSD
jgi:hypothetical protein